MGAQERVGSVRRRRLIVVAVDGYKESPDGFDEAIATQVERITGWLADPELDEDRRFEVSRAPSVRSVDALREFLRKEDLAAAKYREAVVVYITGHGVRRTAPRHFLMLADTDPERPFATAFPTSELITAVLDSHSEHVLVLVDSCFSGTLDAELTGLREALSKERRDLDGAAVVTAGDHEEQPWVGSFTERVALACARMRDEAAGYTAPHLSFREWGDLLDEVGRDDHGVEKDLVKPLWVVPRSPSRGPSACLPNPRYRAPVSTTGPALRQLALTPTRDSGGDTGTDARPDSRPDTGVLDEFWLERASGRTAADDPGWYFSGRAAPMSRMTRFLHDAEGVLVVTGAAGSGKSALLARLVTLSDPGFVADPRYAAMVAGIPAELRPEPGTVDVAVLARNKSARVIIEDLRTGLGHNPAPTLTRAHGHGPGTEPPLQALLRRVLERATAAAGPVTVVIDALDEADDPLAVFNDVVLPLARLHGPDGVRLVRLLLGIRSSPEPAEPAYPTGADLLDERADQLLLRLTEALHDEGLLPGTLRTDGPDCAADIAAYAATLLLATPGSPYHGSPEAAAETAGVIADAVAPSFLDARIAADQLRRADARQDLTGPEWLGSLADGTTGLLREDIRAVSLATGVPSVLLVAALRATAFAPGAGLPWAEVWPAVTTALSAAEYGADYVTTDTADHAIRTLRASRLTGYLATDEEDARTVYRPVHQRLTDLLLADPSWLLVPSWATESTWWRPDDARQVLVSAHAALANALAGLVERSGPRPAHPYVRRHFLHHAAAGEVLDDLHVPLELLAQETSGSLRTRLGLPLPTANPRLKMLTAAALIEPHMDNSVDMASRIGSIAFQRGVRGEPWEPPVGLPASLAWGLWAARVNVLAPTRGRTQSLCVVPTLDGRALIASLSHRGAVRIWDSETGRLAAELEGGPGIVRGMCPIRATGGRTFLVTWHTRGVTIQDPGSGQIITAMSAQRIRSVHVLEDGADRWKLFVVTDRGAFVWWPDPLGTGPGTIVEAEGLPETPSPEAGVSAIVVRRADGQALVALSTSEGIRLWDPSSGLTPHPPFGNSLARSVLAVSRPGDDDLLVVVRGLAGSSLAQLWDPFRGEQVPHRRLLVRAPVALPGGAALASIRDSRIVVQNIADGGERIFDADVPSVEALALLDGETGVRFVSAGPQGIRLWDLAQDTALYEEGLQETLYEGPGRPFARRRMWALCRSSLPRSQRVGEVVVLGARYAPETRGHLEVRDAATGELVKHLDTGPARAVEPIPSPSGTAYVAVEGRRSWSVWDLVSGETVHVMERTTSTAWPTCFTTTPDGLPMAVRLEEDRVIRYTVWDPADGTEDTSSFLLNTPISSPLSLAPVPASHGATAMIAVVGWRAIVLVELASERIVTTLRYPGGTGTAFLRPCIFPSCGRILLAAATSADIRLWDTAGGSPVAHWQTPDTLALAAIPLDTDRTLLASGDPSGVRIWDPLTGELRHTLLTGAPVHALAVGAGPAGPVLHVHGPAGLATLTLDARLL